MKPRPLLIALTIAVLTSGCAQSPLYDTARVAGGTRDEVPRDGNGEPMLSAVRAPVRLPAPPTR